MIMQGVILHDHFRRFTFPYYSQEVEDNAAALTGEIIFRTFLSLSNDISVLKTKSEVFFSLRLVSPLQKEQSEMHARRLDLASCEIVFEKYSPRFVKIFSFLSAITFFSLYQVDVQYCIIHYLNLYLLPCSQVIEHTGFLMQSLLVSKSEVALKTPTC